MEPAPKVKGIADFLDAVFDRTNKIENSECTTCGEPVGEFWNETSRKEYALSGMCQACQDAFFNLK